MSANAQMREHIPLLRRAGWALLAIGVMDIGFMVYCIANDLNYSSSLNIFAVIAGIFLLRGNLTAAQVVTWFIAFMLTAFLIGSVAVFPWIQPMDYWMREFREDPFGSLVLVCCSSWFSIGCFGSTRHSVRQLFLRHV